MAIVGIIWWSRKIDLRIQGQITHTETGKEFRIFLPPALTNAFTGQVPVTVGRSIGLTVPGQLFAEMNPGGNFIRFISRTSDGSAPVTLTSDYVASATTLRFELSGTIPLTAPV